jgi:hypothetical protein
VSNLLPKNKGFPPLSLDFKAVSALPSPNFGAGAAFSFSESHFNLNPSANITQAFFKNILRIPMGYH